MAKIHTLELSGGLQNRTSRFMRQTNELKLLINGHTDSIGSLTKRLGFRKVGATVQSGKSITGLADAGTYLYVGSNNSGDTAGQLKYNNSATDPVAGTWTAVSGGTAIPANVYYSIVPFAEIKALIIAGATTSPSTGANFMTTLTATYAAPGTTTDVSNAPKSKFAIRFRDRIYHGYCAENAGWTTTHWYNETVAVKPNRIVFSEPPMAGALTYEDQGVSGYSNFLDLGDDCTGLAATPNDQLAGFTANSMWILSGDATLSWRKRFNIGCDSHWSIRNADVYTFWFNRNGIYAYSGGKPEKISTRIQPIIDAISDPTAVFAETPDDDHYRLWVGTLTLEGLTFYNCVLQYTLSTNSWTIYSYSVPTTPTNSSTFKMFGSFNQGSKTRMYAGSSVGQVYVLSEPADTGTSLIYTDGDQTSETYPISFLARTAQFDFGSPSEEKLITAVVIYSTNGQGASFLVRTDPKTSNGEFLNVGQIEDDIEIFEVPNSAAYWHQFEVTETSNNPPLTFEGFSVGVNERSSNIS